MKILLFPDQSRLYHKCIGSGCSFCEWRKHTTIDIGWEKLLEDPSVNLCGVDLTSSQLLIPIVNRLLNRLSTFWVALKRNSVSPTWLRIWTSFNSTWVLQCCWGQPDRWSEGTDQPCTSIFITTAKTIAFSSTSTCAYGSPKGEKAIEVAKRGSVPKKTRDNTKHLLESSSLAYVKALYAFFYNSKCTVLQTV